MSSLTTHTFKLVCYYQEEQEEEDSEEEDDTFQPSEDGSDFDESSEEDSDESNWEEEEEDESGDYLFLFKNFISVGRDGVSKENVHYLFVEKCYSWSITYIQEL